jgi:(p)ppGpp synthase/HD superfamily hydrolase
MYPFAQTNLQLFHQLRNAGYDEADLVCIHQAYQLACQVFTGFFRGSGKPFIAHLIGTASILAFVNAPIEIIAAGLLHAVYEFGDFGDGGRGISTKKQRQVRQAVGAKIETYVARYTALLWQEDNIINIYQNLEQFDRLQKDILLMRLANELEDYLDGGVLYCDNAKKRLNYLNSCGHLMVEISIKLGYSQLATVLDRIFQETFSQEVPPALQNNTSYSYVLTTSSPLKRFIGTWRYRLLHRLKTIFNQNNQNKPQELAKSEQSV